MFLQKCLKFSIYLYNKDQLWPVDFFLRMHSGSLKLICFLFIFFKIQFTEDKLKIYTHTYIPLSLILLKRSLIFPILLLSSISLHWSLRKAFLFLLAILWNSAFRWVYLSFTLLFTSLLFTAICKASSDSHFAFLHFIFLGDGLDPCLLYNVTNLRP